MAEIKNNMLERRIAELEVGKLKVGENCTQVSLVPGGLVMNKQIENLFLEAKKLVCIKTFSAAAVVWPGKKQ